MEDVLFTTEMYLAAKRVCITDTMCYAYCHRLDSETTRLQDSRSLANIFDTTVAFFDLWQEAEKEGLELEADILYKQTERFIDYAMNLRIRLSDHEKNSAKNSIGEGRKRRLFNILVDHDTMNSLTPDFSEADLSELREEQHVFIYGAGKVATELYHKLKKYGIEVKGFLVENAENNPEEIDGIKVYGAENNLKEKNGEKISSEMQNTLIIMGVGKNKIPQAREFVMNLGYKRIKTFF